MVDAAILKSLVEAELSQLNDARVMAHIRRLLVEPRMVMRNWDYGPKRQQFPSWSVLEDVASNRGIAYSEFGHGPKTPWGLVFLGTDAWYGMDSAWYTSFRDPYFEGFADDLDIWRVFKGERRSVAEPITPEGSWRQTWEKVYELRKADPQSYYDCEQAIDWPKPLAT